MAVTSTKGDRLGNVIRTGAETFVVEKGVFFPKDYELRYDHITAIRGDDIVYTLSDADARFNAAADSARAAAAASAAAQPPPPRAPGVVERGVEGMVEPVVEPLRAPSRTDDVHIALMEEEIGIEKVPRETGHVIIHKTVKTEEKHFNVPVSREDVVIERVSATGEEGPVSEELAFQEQTLDLPLHEEDVRVTKHTRVREEIIVHPVVQAIEKEATTDLRHEEAEIEDTRGRAPRGEETPTLPGYSAPGRR